MPRREREFFRYFPVSQRDRLWGLWVNGVGLQEAPAHYRSYPRSAHPSYYMFAWETGRVLQEYQALYVFDGDGEFESRTAGHRKVKPGSMMLLFPGEWHRYRPRAAVGWREYWASFNGEIMDQLVAREFFSPHDPVLSVGEDDAILRAYHVLLEYAASAPIGFQQLMAVSVTEILAAALAAAQRHRGADRSESLVRQAKAFLEEHTDDPPRMGQLAASFQISVEHFRRLFKQHTGLSPYQYYFQLRINRAKHLLRGTDLTIKQIAATLRFENPYHFSQAFKKKVGVAPSQWRRGD